MRILICEDSVLLREGLVRLLEDAGHEVVAALPDTDGLMDAVVDTDPELCILDVRLPPTSSLKTKFQRWPTSGSNVALDIDGPVVSTVNVHEPDGPPLLAASVA